MEGPMPTKMRHRTKYSGVYYTEGRSSEIQKTERIYYIIYRKNGKQVEEKVGRQFRDKMTPGKAAKIRTECIEGKRLSPKESRSLGKQTQKRFTYKELEGIAERDVKHRMPQVALQGGKQKEPSTSNTTSVAGKVDELVNPVQRVDGVKDSGHEMFEARLKASEEKFWTIFENANDVFMYVSRDGYIINVNNKMQEIYGYKREEVIGRHYQELGFQVFSKEAMKKISAVYQQLTESSQSKVNMELEVLCKDGTKAFVEASSIIVKEDGRVTGILAIFKDISKRKEAELKLKAAYSEMENKVMERTANLEEMNTALKVLLEKRDEDRFELEKKVRFNVEKLIMPSLEKLKESNRVEMQKTYLDIIKNNLNDIISPFLQGAGSWDLTLTPTEIQVANLIKQQKTTKEIAELLNISISAIVFHRHNIRKKLGLVKKKTNLKSYLQSTS